VTAAGLCLPLMTTTFIIAASRFDDRQT